MSYPEEALAHGVACHRAGQLAEARSVYEALISHSLDSRVNGAALSHLATIHLRQNRVQDAQMAASQALERNDDNGTALWAWVQCERRLGRPESSLDTLTRRSTHTLPPQLLHELALSYEALGEHRKAFLTFKEVKRRLSFADLDVDRSLLLRYMENTSRSPAIGKHSHSEDRATASEPPPLFIVGFNESGITELGRMLGRHPGVRLASEIPAIDAARKRLNGKDPGGLNEVTSAELSDARKAYFQTIDQHAPGGGVIVDALPLNLLATKLIHTLFPQSEIIHCVRNPMDAVIETFFKPYALNNVTCHFDRLERTALTYAGVLTLAQQLVTEHDVPMATVHYEDLMTHPGTYIDAIANSVGIDWTGQHSFGPRSTVPRWVNYKTELSRWLPTLQPLSEVLGYPAK
jgi:tetratricopeptide (TPR) repeat protein